MNTLKQLTKEELLNTLGGDNLPPVGKPDTSLVPPPPAIDPYTAPGSDPSAGLKLEA